ncbi:MAG TPA: YdcF family protein [Gemmatimonadaceae bacterium]|nr:YdcF family protein [Gemmatimonadaceae bacterium]
MNLAKHGPAAGYGALLGALGAALLRDLGAVYVAGNAGSTRWIWVGFVVGALLAIAARVAVVAWMDVAIALLWVVVAYSPLMAHLAPSWARQDPLPPNVDALMSLSGGLKSDSALSADGIDRLLTGLELAKALHVPELVTSRAVARTAAGRITSDADQRRMIALAEFPGHWDIVFPVRTTRDEALRAARLLLPARAHLIVVTSPLHTRRACATFERVGFIVTCRVALAHEYDTRHPETPSDRLASFREYVYERLGMVKYRYEGWVGR